MISLAEAIETALLAHPAVVRLDGGPHNAIATYRTGGRLVGVAVTDPAGPVEIAVVLRFGRPVPAVLAELRRSVRDIAGQVKVDVTVSDITGI